jgi:hypothetical protein
MKEGGINEGGAKLKDSFSFMGKLVAQKQHNSSPCCANPKFALPVSAAICKNALTSQ